MLFMLGGRLVQAQTTLDAALNAPGGALEFTSYSTIDPPYPWTVVTGHEATHDGASAARSGAIGYSNSSDNPVLRSILSTTLTGSGLLTFWAKGAGHGELSFYINDVRSRTIEASTGSVGEWRFHQLKLPLANQNTVKWCFENLKFPSQPGQTEHYFLLDEVCWHPADEHGCVYQLNEDGESYAVWAYCGQAVNVNVPAMLRKPVTVISENPFADKKTAERGSARRIAALRRTPFHTARSSVTLPQLCITLGQGRLLCQGKAGDLASGLTGLGESAFMALA